LAIVLLPLGAIEKHGPHLPLETDTILAEALARRCAPALQAVVAPPITATAASFAADFPGTISADPEEERRTIVDHAARFLRLGAARVVLVNLHFDPAHMRAVRAAVAELNEKEPGRVAFPDFTRRAHAQRIGGEFATGACHAGEFETSMMLAVAPDLVGDHRSLPPREVNLAQAIRGGARSFRELGLEEGYCGHPSTASAKEGERLLGILAELLAASGP
jgi:creatinine amidohydrolase